MPTYKIKAISEVAKVFSLWRTPNNPQQQQKQTDAQEDEASQASGDTLDHKEGISPSKEPKLSENESANDEGGKYRRWEPYIMYSTMKLILAVLVVCALVGMIPLYLRDEVLPESGEKVIMLWNEDPRKMPKGSAHMECGCVITSRKKNYERAVDAVVFNAHRFYSLKYLPKINRTRDFLSVFAARDPLSLAEDPPLPPTGNRPPFNLTMTYRLDSQLVWSEFYFSLLNQAKRLNSFRAPSKHYADNMPGYEMQMLENQTKTKDTLTMYIVYEIDEATFPESLYLQEFRKYVRLYAHKSCFNYERCKNYYFMLIFDSTACQDYVPTQVYEAMYKFVVPVLIGGGNMAKLLPPHSYISSRDYPKPEDLAAYMKHLRKTPEEYKSYFWWHSIYKLRRNPVPYCQLCLFLKQPKKERRIETSFVGWWYKKQCPKQLTTFL